MTKHSFQVHDIELWWSTIRILLELPSVTRIFQISIRMYKNLRDASDEVHCTASRTRLHHNKRNCLLYMAFPLKLVHDNIVVGIFYIILPTIFTSDFPSFAISYSKSCSIDSPQILPLFCIRLSCNDNRNTKMNNCQLKDRRKSIWVVIHHRLKLI